MIYFIPSWNSISNGPTEFDDIVHQLLMFQESGVDVELLLPSYLPNIRYQLNKRGLTDIKYWSVFEHLQQIESVVGLPIKLENLELPKNSEIIYTPACIIIMVHQQLVAKIYYSEFGFVSNVIYFKEKQIIKQNTFDDRGFLSSTTFFDEGRGIKTNYFDNNENVILSHDILTNQIIYDQKDNKSSYDSIENLIIFHIQKHLQKSSKTHALVVSASLENSYLTQLSKWHNHLIVSFFGNRFDFQNVDVLKLYLENADSIVVDTQYSKEKIMQATAGGGKHLIQEMPPFEARLMLGNSQAVKLQKIYWYIDLMSVEQISKVSVELIDNIISNDRLALLIAAKNASKFKLVMKQMFDSIKSFYEISEDSFVYQAAWKKINDESENKLSNSNSDLESTKEWINATDAILTMQRIEGKVINTENDVINGLENARLILDLNSVPDVFLQISGLSLGLPQINFTESVYVNDRKNGLIIRNIDQLSDALSYYLDVLEHWNEALVNNVAQIEKFSGKRNVER